MKKNYLLTGLILFCLVQTTIAQPYPSIFGKNTTQFNVFFPFMAWKGTMDYDPELGEGSTEYCFFEHGNDTIFNDQTYQIGVVLGSGNYITYVREDTLTGKVYSYASKCNEEYLVCDFSLNEGDTFKLQRCQQNSMESDGSIVVNAVVNIEGKKVIYFEDFILDGVYKIYFIEGVGATFGTIGYRHEYSASAPGVNILLCVHKDEELIYIRNPESSYGCDYQYGTNIDEHSKNTLNLYPNPAYSTFQIKGIDDFQNVSIVIYNIYGEIVRQKQAVNKEDAIHIEDLCKGVYIVSISTENRMVSKCKLIKL